MKQIFRKNDVYLEIVRLLAVFSIFILIAVTIVISLIFNTEQQRRIRDQYENSLSDSITFFDTTLSNIADTLTHITLSSEIVADIFSTPDQRSVKNSRAGLSLNTIATKTQLINEMRLYLEEQKCVIYSDTHIEDSVALPTDNLMKAYLDGALSCTGFQRNGYTTDVYVDGENLCLFRPFPFTGEKRRGVLMCRLNSSLLRTVMQSHSYPSGLSMLSPDGTLLLSGASDEDRETLSTGAAADAASAQNAQLGASWIQRTSPLTGMRFVTNVGRSSFIMPGEDLALYLLITSMPILAATMLLAKLLIARYVTPLQEMVRTAEESFGTKETTGGNELTFLKNVLSDYSYNRSTVDHILNGIMPELKEQFIRNLLTGRVTDRAYVARIFQMLAIPFDDEGSYAVAVLSDFNEETTPEWLEKAAEILDTYPFDTGHFRVVTQILYRERHLVLLAELRDMDYPQMEMEWKIFSGRADNEFRKAGLMANVGRSELYNDVMLLESGYRQAVYYCFQDHSDRIREYDYMHEQAAAVIDAAVRDGLASAMDDISRFAEHVDGLTKPLSSKWQRLEQFRVILLSKASERYIPMPEDTESHSITYPSEMTEDIYQSAREEFIGLYKDILMVVTDYYKGYQTSRIRQVFDYLDAHYLEPDVSLNSIAEAVGLNPTYLSKLFKAKTNVNFLEYLNTLRVKKAQELLADTDTSIKDIASAVGYTSQQTFIRVFGKYTGMTPGRYRRSLIMSE